MPDPHLIANVRTMGARKNLLFALLALIAWGVASAQQRAPSPEETREFIVLAMAQMYTPVAALRKVCDKTQPQLAAQNANAVRDFSKKYPEVIPMFEKAEGLQAQKAGLIEELSAASKPDEGDCRVIPVALKAIHGCYFLQGLEDQSCTGPTC